MRINENAPGTIAPDEGLVLDGIVNAMQAVDLKTYKAKLESRLEKLVVGHDKLKFTFKSLEDEKAKVLAKINAFTGAIEECQRCIADLPK